MGPHSEQTCKAVRSEYILRGALVASTSRVRSPQLAAAHVTHTAGCGGAPRGGRRHVFRQHDGRGRERGRRQRAQVAQHALRRARGCRAAAAHQHALQGGLRGIAQRREWWRSCRVASAVCLGRKAGKPRLMQGRMVRTRTDEAQRNKVRCHAPNAAGAGHRRAKQGKSSGGACAPAAPAHLPLRGVVVAHDGREGGLGQRGQVQAERGGVHERLAQRGALARQRHAAPVRQRKARRIRGRRLCGGERASAQPSGRPRSTGPTPPRTAQPGLSCTTTWCLRRNLRTHINLLSSIWTWPPHACRVNVPYRACSASQPRPGTPMLTQASLPWDEHHGHFCTLMQPDCTEHLHHVNPDRTGVKVGPGACLGRRRSQVVLGVQHAHAAGLGAVKRV